MESIPHAFDAGDNGPGIVAANITVVTLATIAVVLRVVSRRMQKLSLQADDYLIFVALYLAAKYGPGQHIGTVHPHDLSIEGKAILSHQLIWAASIPLVKISILLLYIRIFGSLRYFRILAYIIGIFSICWGIMIILVCSFQCRPVQYSWDKSIEGTCINAPLSFIIASALNVFTDFVLLVLPLPAVWNLHTTTSQKISLTVIFLLGSLTCVISLVRFVELITKITMDLTWSLCIWSTAESNLGIVSACLPTMRPLLRRFLSQSIFRSAKSSRQSGRSSAKMIPPTESFGSSGFNRLKIGRSQFRALDDDAVDHVPELPRM
ncbi:MAG: hypothetical protein Q9226_002549 [Calogaya cf. arnoldii]